MVKKKTAHSLVSEYIEPTTIDLKSKKELAMVLKISISMIDKLMASGLPHYKIGRSVRFNQMHVMEFLERKRYP